ncbi:hypothetical protein B0H16DRAFT_1518296 [Mycena metata]|uniref:Uncharacterized protein n=1 Tax=Mycena metata TaxID=1033252 RepID=A0AAD7JQY5_9AGAR|nr:hypothetical protein B0H16DRAFT_1518296 [Mycena metata]
MCSCRMSSPGALILGSLRRTASLRCPLTQYQRLRPSKHETCSRWTSSPGALILRSPRPNTKHVRAGRPLPGL